ncbi:MAG TPA: deoxyguanosinetriphosphate triphosphohydrolase [Actinomycetota bacterium]|nr:deoxyguanosinetriphosphate triphosphohydrolase [Actinomycetota bacterium]
METRELTFVRLGIEAAERANLSPYAARATDSRGRQVPEEEHPLRTAYQRDRDRILHTKAFRRLGHKTQVFLAPEGDHVRVRLTHTLEVTQIARTIARALRLNEDLVEAICLGHDLGHTPFGHLGEEVLSEFLGTHAGPGEPSAFRHNEQSLRIVDCLEIRGERRGLNLTWEVRDGIVNHTWSMPPPSTLEAQIARYADRIAYVNHDIDDALRAGVLALADLPGVTRQLLGETPSDRIDAMVGAVVEASLDQPQIGMRATEREAMAETRAFLFRAVYQRPGIAGQIEEARHVLGALCTWYWEHPEALPGAATGSPEGTPVPVRVLDYVGGMTDRFALREYERVAGMSPGSAQRAPG